MPNLQMAFPENIRVKLVFCYPDGVEMSEPSWAFTEPYLDRTRPLYEWVRQQFAKRWPSHPSTVIQAMEIEQVPIHKRDLSRAPLGLLRDNDSLKVTMAEPALYE